MKKEQACSRTGPGAWPSQINKLVRFLPEECVARKGVTDAQGVYHPITTSLHSFSLTHVTHSHRISKLAG